MFAGALALTLVLVFEPVQALKLVGCSNFEAELAEMVDYYMFAEVLALVSVPELIDYKSFEVVEAVVVGYCRSVLAEELVLELGQVDCNNCLVAEAEMVGCYKLV